MKRCVAVVTALVLAGAAGSSALAKEMKGSGTNEYKTLSATPVGGENSGKVRIQNQGTVKQKDESGPFHGATQTCTGIYQVDAEGAPVSSAGYCDLVDADGDMWALHFTGDAGGGKWTIVWGTGKFEGLKGSGTTKTLPAPGENMTALEWEGSWTMK